MLLGRATTSIASFAAAIFLGACQSASAPPAVSGNSLVIHGGSTTVSRYDADANIFSLTANLPVQANPGALSFAVTSGVHGGKILTITANSTMTALYESGTGTYRPGPALPFAPTSSLIGFARRDSASTGNFMILDGQQSGNAVLYIASTGAWSSASTPPVWGASMLTWNFTDATNHYTLILGSVTPHSALFHHEGGYSIPVYSFPVIVGNGAHGITIPSGVNAGKGLAVLAGNQRDTILVDGAGGVFLNYGPNIPLTPYPADGACSFVIGSGVHLNKILVIHAGVSKVTSIYDPGTNAFSAGPLLTDTAGAGAHVIQIVSGVNAGKALVVHGNNAKTTSLYEPGTNTFVAGPALAVAVTAGGHAVSIP